MAILISDWLDTSKRLDGEWRCNPRGDVSLIAAPP